MEINPIIIIPDYKATKTDQETFCLRSLQKLQTEVDSAVVLPLKESGKTLGDEHIFADYYFQSIITYSQLMMWSGFWEDFLDYSHMLVFQPDCYLFGDSRELEFWCKLNYFFVGSPHFKDYNYQKNPKELQNTMNGGFSLRNIRQHWEICKELESRGFNHKKCQAHEDTFWVEMAKKFELRLPDPLLAARFGWEQGAEVLYQLIGEQKPFGCHAPQKYQKEYPPGLINF